MAATSELRRRRLVLARRVAAATTLQAAVRASAARRHAEALRALAHLAALSKLHAAATQVQRFTRRRQLRRRRAAASRRIAGLLRTVVAVRQLFRFKHAILRLQSRLRARRLRARTYRRWPQLAEIAERAERARLAAVADPRLWLCNRTNAALETLLTSKNLGDVLRAVSSLEMFTLIAPHVCERMVAEGATPKLFLLLATCNRSAPHQKIVGHGLRALLNIGRHDTLRPALCEHADAVPILVELLQANYRDKASHALLWDATALLAELVLKDPTGGEWRATVAERAADCVKRIESVHALLCRQEAASSAKASAAGKPPPPRGKPPLRASNAPSKGPAPKGAAAPKSAPLELASKVVVSLKAVLSALGK